jgi:hypothetical protein
MHARMLFDPQPLCHELLRVQAVYLAMHLLLLDLPLPILPPQLAQSDRLLPVKRLPGLERNPELKVSSDFCCSVLLTTSLRCSFQAQEDHSVEACCACPQ